MDLRERTALRKRSLGFDLADGTRVNVHLATTGNKTQVAVEHERLPDAAAAEQAKAMWRKRLATLKDLLENQQRPASL